MKSNRSLNDFYTDEASLLKVYTCSYFYSYILYIEGSNSKSCDKCNASCKSYFWCNAVYSIRWDVTIFSFDIIKSVGYSYSMIIQHAILVQLLFPCEFTLYFPYSKDWLFMTYETLTIHMATFISIHINFFV